MTEQQEKCSFDPEGITKMTPLMATTQINPSPQFNVLDEIKKWHGCSLTTAETLHSTSCVFFHQSVPVATVMTPADY